MILTPQGTSPGEDEQHAWHIVRVSQACWIIEDFHRRLESGCRLEWARLQEERSPLSLTHFGDGRASGPTPPQGNHK